MSNTNEGYEYTWIRGEFYVREKGAFWWRHLSEFPVLYKRANDLHNAQCLQLFDALGTEVQCNESEGWYLHTVWHGGINKVAKAPQGLMRWVHAVASVYRGAGILGVLFYLKHVWEVRGNEL